MDINQLRQFVTVCDEQSYSKAAKRLYISRQALRKSILLLEEEIGAPLFLYQSNRLYLTIEGERLRCDAVNVLAAFDLLVSNNITSKDGREPTFRLAVDETTFPFMATLFLPQINEFFNDHPEINYILEEKSEEAILEELKNGKTDGGVLILPHFDFPFLDDYSVINLVPGKPAIAVNRHNADMRFAQYPYSALAGQTLIFPGNGKSLMQRALLQLLNDINASPGAIKLTSSVEECAGEMIKGNGVSFCTYPGCKKLLPAPAMIHIPMEDSTVGFNLVLLLRKDSTNSCVELLKRYLGRNPME